MESYFATLKHDNGIFKFTVLAQDEKSARKLICDVENCPDRAIQKIIDLKFYNKTGQLNAYGLACGYVERKENRTHWKELYMEHSHYHVRKGTIGGSWEIWETFDNDKLKESRKFYNSIKLK